MHVSEVVFSLDVVLVVTHELIFVGEFEEDGEEAEEFFDYFCVAFLILFVSQRLIASRLGYIPD
jgi:hypothetical protein